MCFSALLNVYSSLNQCLMCVCMTKQPCRHPAQARSQDLEKGGGYFTRVRSVQTTLTRIFIAFESVSHGLHEN